MPTENLTKKTKAEVLAAYEALRADYERATAQGVIAFSPAAEDAMTKGRTVTVDAVANEIAQAKRTIAGRADELSRSLNSEFDALLAERLAALKKFSELDSAIASAEQRLLSDAHLEVAANALATIVADFETKNRKLEEEFRTRGRQLEEEIATRRREAARQDEEAVYRLKLDRAREQERIEAELAKQEQAFAEREKALAARETELLQLHQQLEEWPKKLEQALMVREREVVARVEAEAKRFQQSVKAEWDAEKRLLEVRQQGFIEEVKRLQTELAVSRKETEAATKRAQELAVKIIESGTHHSKTSADANAAPSTPSIA